MTQTKLEILGPYTPEHEGPFCTRYGRRARIICVDRAGDFPIIALVEDGEGESLHTYSRSGSHNPPTSSSLDLMNACEIPEPREFWINECRRGDGSIGNTYPHETECEAARERQELPHWNWVRTIHVREVMPGEGE